MFFDPDTDFAMAANPDADPEQVLRDGGHLSRHWRPQEPDAAKWIVDRYWLIAGENPSFPFWCLEDAVAAPLLFHVAQAQICLALIGSNLLRVFRRLLDLPISLELLEEKPGFVAEIKREIDEGRLLRFIGYEEVSPYIDAVDLAAFRLSHPGQVWSEWDQRDAVFRVVVAWIDCGSRVGLDHAARALEALAAVREVPRGD